MRVRLSKGGRKSNREGEGEVKGAKVNVVQMTVRVMARAKVTMRVKAVK